MPHPFEGVTEETLKELLSKAATGIYANSGMTGVDLSGRVSLVPVNVPARNNTSAFPRETAGEGDTLARWRAWINVNNQQYSAAVGVDFPGSATLFQEQDCFAPYKPLAKFGRVTLEGVAFGRNYYEGGSGPASTAVTQAVATTGASTCSVTATWAAVKGAVAYDVYVGSASGGANQWYYTTVTTGSVTITSIPTAAQAVPTATLPLISTLAPGVNVAPLAIPPTAGNGHPPTVDTSFSANYYNGIIASSLGDYGSTGPVTPGSGTASGATFIDAGGAALTLSGGGISLLDQINDSLWASVQLSPTAYMVNSLQGDEISKLILGSTSATTFLPPTDADARTNLAGGGFIGRYVNRAAGGVPVPIEVHPRVAPGTVIGRTDRVPFPGSNIGSVFAIRCQYDSMRFDYAAAANLGQQYGGPRYDFEVRSLETLVNHAPVAQAVASNVG